MENVLFDNRDRFTTTWDEYTLMGIGCREALLAPMLAVVGNRRCTPYALRCVEALVPAAVSAGYTILTGGSLGVATQAVEVALDCGGVCVCLLGGGLNHPYPQSNQELFEIVTKSDGCILSMQVWEELPRPHMFRARNFLMARMAHVMLAVEAGMPSGTLAQCEEALKLKKSVFAVPGEIFSTCSLGTNHLLAHGAKAASSPGQFSEALEAERIPWSYKG